MLCTSGARAIHTLWLALHMGPYHLVHGSPQGPGNLVLGEQFQFSAVTPRAIGWAPLLYTFFKICVQTILTLILPTSECDYQSTCNMRYKEELISGGQNEKITWKICTTVLLIFNRLLIKQLESWFLSILHGQIQFPWVQHLILLSYTSTLHQCSFRRTGSNLGWQVRIHLWNALVQKITAQCFVRLGWERL